ncbi:MAG: lysoplasmalogenase [Deltaproteobacteria bacterium]
MPELPPLFLACVTITVLATIALLIAESRNEIRGVWLTKPVAALGFLGAALAVSAPQTSYGAWILTGLVLSFVGDVLLIPRDSEKTLLAGLVSFLLGHLAYAVAFGQLGLNMPALLGAALVLALVAAVTLRWLLPHVEGPMRAAVAAYTIVITAMVLFAASAYAETGAASVLIGALLFYVSDLAVARQQFVAKSITNRLWGLPLYFAGQLVLAASILAIG